MLDIQNKAIANFLDAADSVLNSNTFLLGYIPTYPENIQLSLKAYLKSKTFQAEIIRQDRDRGWYNMQMFDEAKNDFIPYKGNLLKPNFHLQLSILPIETRQYLIGMLMADHKVGNFFSAYQQSKSRLEAEKIVDVFLESITGGAPLDAFSIVPDFLFNAGDIAEEYNDNIQYFEGETSCDSATLLCLPQKHFLLLTNGID